MSKESSAIPHIILHAGGPKTGSGSIQRAFNPQKPQISKDLLNNLGFRFFYSQKGITSNLGGLVSQLFSGNLSSYELTQWKHAFSEQIRDPINSRSPAFVFSSERMGSPHLGEVRSDRVVEFVKSLGSVEHVIYYARPILSLALSLGLQHAKSGKSQAINSMTKIRDRHIVDKYLMYSSSYEHAQISFCRFDRQALLGGDVRIDIASRISSLGDYFDDLEAQIRMVPPANEKIDLPIFLLLKKIYHEAVFSQGLNVPQLFINFITMGKWAGPPCMLSDLYTSEEIEILHQLSDLEVLALGSAGTNSGFLSLADSFRDSLMPKSYYMNSHESAGDLGSYRFKMTGAQRNIIRIMLSKMRKMSLRQSLEFKILLPIVSDPLDADYCASELLPSILNCALLIS
jgi:hypothetical protein